MSDVVDVLLVSYHSADLLPGCLSSLPPGTHPLVVDNASSDGSADVAEGLGARVIRNDRNLGFGRAVNQAMGRCEGEFVLLLNPDARIGADTIATLLAEFEDPTVAAAGARYVTETGEPAERPWWEFPSSRLAWTEAFGLHRVATETYDEARTVDFAIGACLMIRRAAFDAVGGFDPRFWLYGEEADLSRRWQRSGWKVRYVPAATAVHVGGASGVALGSAVREHFARGAERFVLAHEGPAGLVSFRAALTVGSLVRSVAPGDADRRTLHRDRLRRLARVLSSTPTELGPSDPIAATPGLVVASLEAWDDIWRRNQFLVRELLALDPAQRVLFVEPPLDLMYHVRLTRRLPSRPPKVPTPLPDDPRVLTFRPVKWLPRAAGPFADRSLDRQLRRAIRRAELGSTTLWVNNLDATTTALRTSFPVVYDITDDWLLVPAPERARERIEQIEALMFATADEVVVCSSGLEETRSRQRPVRLVPNAVDVEHMRRPQDRPTDLPAGPTAVYVGTIHAERVDLSLVRHAATECPEITFVFVGPNQLDAEQRAAVAMTNVVFLGPRPYAEVPGYLQHADVLIVPHVVSAFTESLDPIKAYEFAAVGRPVLATRVAGFRDVAGVHNAGADDFGRALRRLVGGDDASDPVQVASWHDRALAFRVALDAAAAPATPVPGRELRVVFLGHVSRLSGGEIALLRLLPNLPGISPHVILGEDGPLVAALRERGVSVEVLAMPAEAGNVRRAAVGLSSLPLKSVAQTAGYAWRLRRRLKELSPDLVVTNTLKAAFYGGAAARLAGVPLAWHVRDRIADDYLPGPAVRLIRALARIVPHGLVTNSMATLETLGPIDRGRPRFVAYDGLAADVAPAGRDAEAPVRRVGIVGRISPWKGQDVFLRAFADAFPDGGVEAVVVGTPMFDEYEFEADLQQLVKELEIGERVDFRGFRSDVDAELARLDIVVHASTAPEPFGQVVIEAMAAGVPLIATASGGPKEVVTHEVDGLLVPPGDVDALAAALRRLTAEPATRRRLRDAALIRAADFAPGPVGVRSARAYRRIALAARPDLVRADRP